MTPKFRQRSDGVLAVLLVVAFALAGWKSLSRPQASNFASAPQPGSESRVRRMEASAPGPAFRLATQTTPSRETRFVSAMPGQAVHAASMVELRDGSLRAVWFSGSREGAGDVTIQSAVLSPANGAEWSTESTLFDRTAIERGLMRYVKKLGNPVIARAPDGSLVLWMVNVSLGGWAGSAITWSRSADEGASWSPPRRLVTSPFLNISTLVRNPPVALEGGQTALPVYHEFVTKLAEILRLDAQGQVADKIRIPGSQTSLQPVLLVENPQLARIYMRSAGRPFVTTSTTADAGTTWSSAANTAWPNPDSAVAGLVTADGDTWLAMNPAAAGRETLSLVKTGKGNEAEKAATSWLVEGDMAAKPALSAAEYAIRLGRELRDNGVNEVQAKAYVDSASRQLCNGAQCAQEFSYPYLLQSSDGYIHLVYTWNRTRIKHMRFDPRKALPAAKTGASDASPRQ